MSPIVVAIITGLGLLGLFALASAIVAANPNGNVTCVRCMTINRPHAKYCAQCGKALNPDA